MKTNVLITILIIAVVAIGLASYALRPIAAPSTDVNEVVTPIGDVSAADAQVFVIDQASSQVQFELDEKLGGKPKHVVGTSNDIAGQLAVTIGEAPAVEIGELAINARTLKTDSANRNNAIGRFILKSEEPANEFIRLAQVAVTDLPARIDAGTPFTFTASGNLTIAGVTKPVVFAAQNVVITESQLTGTATATVKRSDFGLEIPSVPSVADVTDEVVLTATLTARVAQ